MLDERHEDYLLHNQPSLSPKFSPEQYHKALHNGHDSDVRIWRFQVVHHIFYNQKTLCMMMLLLLSMLCPSFLLLDLRQHPPHPQLVKQIPDGCLLSTRKGLSDE